MTEIFCREIVSIGGKPPIKGDMDPPPPKTTKAVELPRANRMC